MHLVNNINPKSALRRGILNLLPNIADILHAVVGSSINLHHIERSPSGDVSAGLTFHAGASVNRMLAIYGTGKYLGYAGLAGPPCPAE
jgi:hypothetical protein